MNYDHHFINGLWVRALGDRRTAVHDSATEELIGTVTHATSDEVGHAVVAARSAFKGWAALPVSDRARYVSAIADELEQRADELSASITAEVGMPAKLTRRIQVLAPIAAWRTTARIAPETLATERCGSSLITREPAGVVAAITPWNYPLHQITGKLAAALVAGCAVVLKPSELAPSAAQILGEAIEAAKLPSGVVNILFGNSDTGEALVSHPDIDMISFTGSTAVGRKIAASAGQDLKRVSLELGGKSASLALSEASPELVVRHAVSSCFLNSGQTCSAITRLIIPEDQYESYRPVLAQAAAKMTLGDPRDSATRLGPLVSADQRKRVLAILNSLDTKEIDLIAGGANAPVADKGYYVAPTIVGRASPDSILAQEEIFGPVLTVLTYRSEDEAIELANGTAYGLAGAVWGAPERALAVASQLRAGQIDINGAPFNPEAPFGGFRASGIGREGGHHGIIHFTELRAVQAPAVAQP